MRLGEAGLNLVPKFFAVAVILAAVLAGCSSGSDMSKDEIKTFQHPPPMTDANRKQMSDAMTAGANKELDHEKKWRADHPEEAAKMDAERAAHGLPPIGK